MTQVPWAREGSGFTALFEALALSLCQELPVRQAAALLRCSDKQLWRRIEHYVCAARTLDDMSVVRVIGIDETSLRADGKPYAEQISYVSDRPGHDRRYAIDARKLEAELGWKPAETFETGIRKTVEWYLANPDWVANVQSGAYKDWVSKQYA